MIVRNDPCTCGSGKKFKKCCLGKEVSHASGGGTSEASVEIRNCYTWRTLVHYAGFLGLAAVEPVTDEFLCHEYRVKALPLLQEAVQFQLSG